MKIEKNYVAWEASLFEEIKKAGYDPAWVKPFKYWGRPYWRSGKAFCGWGGSQRFFCAGLTPNANGTALHLISIKGKRTIFGSQGYEVTKIALNIFEFEVAARAFVALAMAQRNSADADYDD